MFGQGWRGRGADAGPRRGSARGRRPHLADATLIAPLARAAALAGAVATFAALAAAAPPALAAGASAGAATPATATTAPTAATPSSPAAPDPTIGAVGINDERSDGILLNYEGWNGISDLNLMQTVGVQLYRARIQMNCVDPTYGPTFDFSSPAWNCGGVDYDDLVAALAARGMTLLPVLMNFTGETPQPPTSTGVNGSPTIAQFAAFAAAAVARYGPDGSFWPTCGCSPHPIHAWEIWNEENNGFWWDGDASASAYATVFAATRTALRSVDPQARAVVGGLTFDPNGQPSFVAPAQMIQALAAQNANAFDAVAVHPYTDATGASATQLAGDAIALLDNLAGAMVAATGPGPHGGPRQQLWVTELGWSNQQADPNVIAGGLGAFFSELGSGARARDNIGPVLWYDLRDNSTLTTRDDQLGLRLTAADGSDAGPKPAWGVFASAVASQGTVPLPPALANSGPYVAPAVARAASQPPARRRAQPGRRARRRPAGGAAGGAAAR